VTIPWRPVGAMLPQVATAGAAVLHFFTEMNRIPTPDHAVASGAW